MIKMEFVLLEAYSFVDIDIIMPLCTFFYTIHLLSCDVLSNIIHKLNITTCI